MRKAAEPVPSHASIMKGDHYTTVCHNPERNPHSLVLL